MEKATKGKWFVKLCDNAPPDSACGISTVDQSIRNTAGEFEGIIYSDDYDECSHFMTKADAILIASVPELAQTALDALQRVEMQSLRIKELEAYIEGTKEGMDAYVKSRDKKL